MNMLVKLTNAIQNSDTSHIGGFYYKDRELPHVIRDHAQEKKQKKTVIIWEGASHDEYTKKWDELCNQHIVKDVLNVLKDTTAEMDYGARDLLKDQGIDYISARDCQILFKAMIDKALEG